MKKTILMAIFTIVITMLLASGTAFASSCFSGLAHTGVNPGSLVSMAATDLAGPGTQGSGVPAVAKEGPGLAAPVCGGV